MTKLPRVRFVSDPRLNCETPFRGQDFLFFWPWTEKPNFPIISPKA